MGGRTGSRSILFFPNDTDSNAFFRLQIDAIEPLEIDRTSLAAFPQELDAKTTEYLTALDERIKKDLAQLRQEEEKRAMEAAQAKEQAAREASAAEIFGTYLYQEEGLSGELTLSGKNTRSGIQMTLYTYSASSICEFEGTCSLQAEGYKCVNPAFADDAEAYMLLKLHPYGLEITRAIDGICGMGAYVHGVYSKQ